MTAVIPFDFYEYVSKSEATPIEDGLRLYGLRKATGESVSKMQQSLLKEILPEIRNLIKQYIDTSEQNIEILFMGAWYLFSWSI